MFILHETYRWILVIILASVFIVMGLVYSDKIRLIIALLTGGTIS